ncbi:hypothetical protein JCM11251_007787 [Rhodosporidiobolus azoricus]
MKLCIAVTLEDLLPPSLDLSVCFPAPSSDEAEEPLYFAELEAIYRSYPEGMWWDLVDFRDEQVDRLLEAEEKLAKVEVEMGRTARWKVAKLRRLRREKKELEGSCRNREHAVEEAERGPLALLYLRTSYIRHLRTGWGDAAGQPTDRQIEYLLENLPPVPTPLSPEQKIHLLGE